MHDASPLAPLAAFAVELGDELPPAVIAAAQRSLADAWACALAAVARLAPVVLPAAEQAANEGGHAQAGAWGLGRRLPAGRAAWLNGISAHALDYDDYTLTSWIGHPTVVLLPALWALAEREGLAGSDVLRGYVAGLEAGARLGAAVGRPHYEAGWHNTATIGAVAGALAAAAALRLAPAAAATAAAIAASASSGLRRQFGTATKPLHAGQAARAAVEAVDLARRGWTAAADPWSGAGGWFAALGAEPATATAMLATATADLGRRWDLVEPGLGLKPYPACAYTHWAIDAARTLYDRGVRLADAVAMELRCDPLVPAVCHVRRPPDGQAGQFCVPYVVAVALRDGTVGLDAVAPTPIADAGVLNLVAASTFHTDARFAERPWTGELVVQTRDGGREAVRVDAPRGAPEAPLAWPDLQAKAADALDSWPDGSAVAARLIAGARGLPAMAPAALADYGRWLAAPSEAVAALASMRE